MDGNGRWAQRRHLPRIEGHRRGVASVRRTTEEAARLHIEQLTLYCLSSENWKRPQRELDFLMHLLEQYMIEERTHDHGQNIGVRVIGRRDGIPDATLAEMDKTIDMSAANTRHAALPGDQLRRPRRNGRRRAADRRRGPPRHARSR